MQESYFSKPLAERRQTVFGLASLIAGFAMTNLCFVPLVFPDCFPKSLFTTTQEEKFFFDLFGLISGCWLLSWVSAINIWTNMAKIGQWLGITLLCIDQVILLEIWKLLLDQRSLFLSGLWITPSLLQAYLAGCFFCFFTLPSLTASGNRSLTGLGTLALLLPWLIGRDEVVTGSQLLNGLFQQL